MIKGVKVQATNSDAMAIATVTMNTAQPLMTIPTGKTFYLTDLVADWTGVDNMTAGNFMPGVALADIAEAGGTAITASTLKMAFKKAPYAVGIGTGIPMTLIVTGLENGPSFSTCIAASNLNSMAAIPTFGLWVGGYLK